MRVLRNRGSLALQKNLVATASQEMNGERRSKEKHPHERHDQYSRIENVRTFVTLIKILINFRPFKNNGAHRK